MAEYLDDLLTVYHFLNVAVYAADSLLLSNEAFAAVSADEADHPYDEQEHCNDYDGELPAVYEHCRKYTDYRYCRRYELRHAVAEHFTDSVGVVGVKAHELAVSVLVKVANGEHFHFVKEVVSDAHESCRGYFQHHALIEERRECSEHVDDAHYND